MASESIHPSSVIKEAEFDLANDQIRILHVDDDLDFLTITKKILEFSHNLNCNITTLNESTAVPHLLKGGSFDIIVSDYSMPMMDGLEVLQLVRTVDKTIPFIMFTGQSREQIAVDALNLGANRYLMKGGDMEAQFKELWHAIETLVMNQRREKHHQSTLKIYITILESISDAVFVTDQSGEFWFICGNVKRLFGSTAKEINKLGNISRVLGELPIDNKILRTEGEQKNIRATVKNSEGKEREILVNVKLFDGKWLFSCRDISNITFL